jgi:hypothetical protein
VGLVGAKHYASVQEQLIVMRELWENRRAILTQIASGAFVWLRVTFIRLLNVSEIDSVTVVLTSHTAACSASVDLHCLPEVTAGMNVQS